MTASYSEAKGDAAALRKKAEDALAVAETMKDPQARQNMRWLAAAYKRLADVLQAKQTEREASSSDPGTLTAIRPSRHV